MTNTTNRKIGLAVQGSYGHVFYATGMLDAFREHNLHASAHQKPQLNIDAGSACVEMLTPLYYYLSGQNSDSSMFTSLLAEFNQLQFLAKLSLLPAAIRPDAWQNYFAGLSKSQKQFSEAFVKQVAKACNLHSLRDTFENVFETAQKVQKQGLDVSSALTTAAEELLMYWSGIPGEFAFNPLFISSTQAGLAQRYETYSGPTIFSNATNAADLNEIYLYYGKEPSDAQKTAVCGTTRRRRLLKMKPEYFFASGARPPYIAPMPVTVGDTVEYWMEGAMRCNPPLTPLIDVGVTHIILLRFFGKDDRALTCNDAELNDRDMDVMFSVPLQKELESIDTNNHLASCLSGTPASAAIPERFRHRRHIMVLDPANTANGAYLPEYKQFINRDLNALSHYGSDSPPLQSEMFERGREIGKLLVTHLQDLINGPTPTSPSKNEGVATTEISGAPVIKEKSTASAQ